MSLSSVAALSACLTCLAVVSGSGGCSKSIPLTGRPAQGQGVSKDEERSAARLRHLHAAFGRYLEAHHGKWPQIPEGPISHEAVAGWWMRELRAFGATASDWQDADIISGVTDLHLSYVPAMMSDAPDEAYRMPDRPWLTSAGRHRITGRSLAILPDGRIRGTAAGRVP